MRFARAAYLAGFSLACILLAGCGIPMAEVKGTVKYDGKLVEEGTIRFEAADGKAPTAGGAIKDGAYTVQVPVGAAKVAISGAKVSGKKKLYDHDPNSPTMDLKAEYLPPRYSDIIKTELKFDVQPGVNTKDWDLSK